MSSDILKAIIKSVPADFASPSADYQVVRETMTPFHGHPTSADLSIDLQAYEGVRCGWHSLPHHNRDGLVALHYHGGAFVSCNLDAYHFYGELICRALDIPVVLPDYRLAPEHPYPAAHDDCFNAYRGLLEAGIRPEQIVVLGESCGGALALATLIRARDDDLPMPACFVSVTGWFDLSVSDYPAIRDPFLTPEWVQNRARDYSQGQLALDDPKLSPCFAELRGLPPLYLQVGEYDTMAPGALELAKNATLSGVEVTVESWPGMIHGWHGLLNAGVPEAEEAWARIKAFIRGL